MVFCGTLRGERDALAKLARQRDVEIIQTQKELADKERELEGKERELADKERERAAGEQALLELGHRLGDAQQELASTKAQLEETAKRMDPNLTAQLPNQVDIITSGAVQVAQPLGKPKYGFGYDVHPLLSTQMVGGRRMNNKKHKRERKKTKKKRTRKYKFGMKALTRRRKRHKGTRKR